jgi:AraC-like DNA-binding protein
VRYPATYSRLLARELRLDHAGEAALLRGTRLAPDALGALDQLITPRDQIILLGNALRLADRPGFGLEVGSRLSLAAHGALGQLLSASPNLGEAWVALERFHALHVPLVRMSREFAQGHMTIRLELECPHDAVGLFLLEAMVVTIQRGIELILGRRLREARLDLAYAAPAHAALYEKFLHSPVRFGVPDTAWHIPRALLEQANPFRDAALYRQALRQCEQMAAALEAGATVEWSLRLTQLLQQHPGKLWTLAEMAAHLHLSPRTLIRHLKAEGLTYQQLLDRELARQALEHFASAGHTVESVALALGYQDATAFRRAFKRWFGTSPRAYLAQPRSRAFSE